MTPILTAMTSRGQACTTSQLFGTFMLLFLKHGPLFAVFYRTWFDAFCYDSAQITEKEDFCGLDIFYLELYMTEVKGGA